MHESEKTTRIVHLLLLYCVVHTLVIINIVMNITMVMVDEYGYKPNKNLLSNKTSACKVNDFLKPNCCQILYK